MISLVLGAGLTVISASHAAAPPPSCAYVAERLPRTLTVYGDDSVSAGETRAARKRLALPEAALTRASALSLARALGGSRLVIVRCQENRDATTIEAQPFDVEHPIAGAVALVVRPRTEIAAAIDEIAGCLAAAGAPSGAAAFHAPSTLALAKAGPALASASAAERARGLAAAIESDPASIDLRLAAVEAYIAARDFDPAIRLAVAPPAAATPAALTRALQFLAGAAQLEAGRYAEAGETFSSLVQDQVTAAALNNLGVARFRLRDPEASALFARAGSLVDQRQNDISFNRCLALIFEGRADQALIELDRALEATPGDARTRLLRVWALRLLARETERGEEWDRLMALAPSFVSLGNPDLARRLERNFFSERLQER